MKTLWYFTAAMVAATLDFHQALAAPATNPLSQYIGQCVAILPRNQTYTAPGVVRTVSETHVEVDVDVYGDGNRIPIVYFMPHVEGAIADPDNLMGLCGTAQSAEVQEKLRSMVSSIRD